MTIKHIIFRISLTILVVEAFIMQAFSLFSLQITVIEETFLDASLLVTFTTPIIYFWIIKPFVIQNEKTLKEISYLTFYDELTGLPNRTKLLDWLDYSIKTSSNNNETVSLILFDIDRFKKISDSFGHNTANNIIIQIAQALSKSVGDEILLTRIGPSSFVFLVVHTQSNDALYLLARKAMSALAVPIVSENRTYNIEASVGISSYPKDATNKEDLLKYAHTAMRQAKIHEDEKIHFYANHLTELIQKHFTLDEDMRRALQNDEFYLLYQPKIDATTNKLMGVEALIRWNHPEKGIISPLDFIPAAEESGLIVPIGEVVLRKAIAQQEMWKSEGKEPITMSINLSGRQLKEEPIKSIIDIIKTASIPAIILEFEMTETYIMKNPQQSQLLLHKLQQTGVSLAIDDFGTGYSSLGYLKRFEVDILKIDKILIDDIEKDSNDLAIVQAIIAMAHTLSIKVVAEGVETGGQVEMLKNIGCDYFQGYYFSKPVVANSVYSNPTYVS